jgi:TolB protein
LTLSGGRAPDVYVMDIDSGGLTRITQGTGTNTGPVWMPDGQSIVFTSDRSGRPQLYQVPAKGGEAKRLTFEGRYNAAADVSPDGGKIAMVHQDGTGDRIALQDLRSGEFLVLTDGRLDESPSFAPNGSMILYATENRGRGVLAAVSVDGKVRQILRQHNEDVREPVWSPFTD